jgi:hypothetical protein
MPRPLKSSTRGRAGASFFGAFSVFAGRNFVHAGRMRWMRISAGALGVAFLAVGCAHKEPAPAKPAAAKPSAPVITPDLRPLGQVATVNLEGRFAVLSFENSPMPTLNEQLGIYRGGAKVGEVKITGPQKENNVVADIVAGEPRVHDEVKPD